MSFALALRSCQTIMQNAWLTLSLPVLGNVEHHPPLHQRGPAEDSLAGQRFRRISSLIKTYLITQADPDTEGWDSIYYPLVIGLCFSLGLQVSPFFLVFFTLLNCRYCSWWWDSCWSACPAATCPTPARRRRPTSSTPRPPSSPSSSPSSTSSSPRPSTTTGWGSSRTESQSVTHARKVLDWYYHGSILFLIYSSCNEFSFRHDIYQNRCSRSCYINTFVIN